MDLDFNPQSSEESSQGYACHKIICDEYGAPCDFQYLEINDEFAALKGLGRLELLGRRFSEIRPEISAAEIDWLSLFGRVARDGGVREIKEYSLALQQWYRVKAFSPEKNCVVTQYSAMIKELPGFSGTAAPAENNDLFFRAMFKNHSAVMLLIDQESGQIIDANDAAEQFYGYTLGQLKTLSIDEINRLPADETKNERFRAFNRECNCFVFKHQLKNGRIRQVEVHSSPIDYHGAVVLFSIVHDITERKQAEEELQIERERLANILEGTNVGTWVWNVQSGKLEMNERGLAILGFQPGEISLTKISDWEMMTHPEDLIKSTALLEKIFAGDLEYFDLECRMKHKDGSWVWVHDRGKVTDWDGVGNPLLMSGTHTDITGRKRTESLLHESEAKYRSIFAAENDALFLIDQETGAIMEANDSASSIYGYAQDEFLRMKNTDVSAEPEQTQQATLNPRTTIPIRYHRKKDGTVFPVEIRSSFLNLNHRRVILAAIRDISERVQGETLLRSSEEKYRLLTEFASDVIWVLNLSKNRFTYVSPSIINLRGLTAAEAMQESTAEAVCPESYQVVQEATARNLREFTENPGLEKCFISEIKQPCKNGEAIWVEVSSKYRYNALGEIESVGVSRNIEQRKKSEEDILYLSYHDQLTGLYNRRFYETELKRMDTARNLPLSIAMGDVNGLKLINDSFGHAMGDQLLVKVAEVIKKECRADDVIARLSGDEFVIILPQTDAYKTEKIIKRIKAGLLTEKIANIDVSISFGYETKLRPEEDIHEILKKTEDHMYRHKLTESAAVRNKTIASAMNALFNKSSGEISHAKNVSEISAEIAAKMDFGPDEIKQIRQAGMMHDIGKIGIDDSFINQPQKLNHDDWKEIERHAEIGYRILSSVNEYSEMAVFVLEHHEKWNGKGYPRGLKGEEISLPARIIAVADAFDAMTNSRSYRLTLSEDEAVIELRKCAGTQFDPQVVRIFTENILGKSRIFLGENIDKIT